jgi:tRNA G18 (ribose-2'-O)-methylase SpoU
MKKKKEIFLALSDIRSNENVGSIFRTADAAGVSKIFLCGYTPAPTDRFGRENKKLCKASLGAEKFISWEKNSDARALVKKFKQEKIFCVSVEQEKNSVDYKNIILPEKTLFIFGNEVEGIPRNILKESDVIAEIPMRGKKESLNVAVSAGVVLFEALNI